MNKKSPTLEYEKGSYEFVGYTTDIMHPEVVNGILLKDKLTGGEFTATVLEAKKLVSNGELILPV